MFWMILLLILMTVAAFFAVQNSAPVTISFILWKFEASLAIVIFLSIITGAVMSAIVCMISRIRKSFRHDKQSHETNAVSTTDAPSQIDNSGAVRPDHKDKKQTADSDKKQEQPPESSSSSS